MMRLLSRASERPSYVFSVGDTSVGHASKCKMRKNLSTKNTKETTKKGSKGVYFEGGMIFSSITAV